MNRINTKSKGGRPVTGRPKWSEAKGLWQAWCAVGGRLRPFPMRGIPKEDTARAAAVAKGIAMTLKNGGAVEVASSETVNEWVERWVESRKAKGLTSTRNDVGRYAKWIAPTIGTMPIVDVTRADVEAIVRKLDEAVRASTRAGDGKFKWKTAVNTWGVLTKMFADACRSKVKELRVREDNPTRDVEGPDRGAERSGPYLFPAEFRMLVESERVPVRWRRLFMLSTYLYVRGGELEALDWSSVNLDQGYVHVHQAIDSDTGEVKTTKTKDTRKVPIEATLMPLLVEMHRESKGEGRVVTAMPPRESLAERLRKYLEWAGVTRADLFADDETRRPLTWHDLRHTGITWRAMRGDEPLKVQRAAGHDDLRTTQKYINEAQTFEADFGDVFPSIPMSLLSPFPGTPSFGEEFRRNSEVSMMPPPNSEAMSGTSGRPQGEPYGFFVMIPVAHRRSFCATFGISGRRAPAGSCRTPGARRADRRDASESSA
ncbi:MAG: site-specific integrase [Polyangiaceae bacterium]